MTNHIARLAALATGAFLLPHAPAQDMIAVAWPGSVYLVDSYTGVSIPFGAGLGGQNALARDGAGTFWTTSRTGASTYYLAMLDPSTGTVTNVHPSIDLRGLATGPGTSLYGINNQSSDTLVQIDTATGLITQIGSTGYGSIQGLAVHQGVLYAWDLNAGILIVDPVTGLATDPFPSVGGTGGLQALCSHPDGRLLVGGGSTTNSLYVVDLTTGAQVLVAQMAGTNDVRGFEPLGGGAIIPFGQGCNGASGPVTLTVSGTPQVGNTLSTVSDNHLPNTLGAIVFGLSTFTYQGLALPLLLDPMLGTANCHLYTSIDVSVIAFTNAATPATLTFGFSLGASAAGAEFHMQHAAFEPVAGGISWSNGVTIRVQ